MPKLYEVIIANYDKNGNNLQYSRLEFRNRTTWKTKRIADKHARDWKANNLSDAWAQEV